MRLAATLVLLGFTLGVFAQVDSSLTDEFSKLSAKERAKIAKKEQEESSNDSAFQEVMTSAEQLFQERSYDAALERFKEARRLRPLNVYPKVKIQDLQALIAKREEVTREVEAEESAPPPSGLSVEQGAPVPVVDVHVDPITVDSAGTRKTAVRPEPQPTKAVKAPFATRVGHGEAPVVREREPEPVVVESALPDGMHERSYLEGRAIVLERRVVKDAKETVFRKVTHPWGQVVHFRDDHAISDREWNEAFGTN